MKTNYDALMDEAIAWCRDESPEFVWKSRIINAVNKKLTSTPDPKERNKLQKKISHLEKWVDDYIEETMESLHEQNMDPYTYHGVSRSDF